MAKNSTHNHPKMEQNLYAKIDEIEISRMIRFQFDVPAIRGKIRIKDRSLIKDQYPIKICKL
jgi:hypothetical protein